MKIARSIQIAAVILLVAVLAMPSVFLRASAAESYPTSRPGCVDNSVTCTEVLNPLGYYTGHDEPSLLFYSSVPGSGNSNTYLLRLPMDPSTLPTQDGTGGTFNFQLHPAFWFGMALCDSQSAPNPGLPCTPDSDSNIFDNANPAAADYIGNHPGTAFMEMQFYPPGWVLWPPGNSCDPLKWCAALNIDSFSENQNTGQVLNAACQGIVGIEYVNFAFITLNGVPHPDPALKGAPAPANPVQSDTATFTPDPAHDLFMNSGDVLKVRMFDTPQGFRVVINDLTAGLNGSMTAGAANGFGQVKFAPQGSSCKNLPYDFHPMYSTSSEHTRVPWAAHSYNIAFSDEIGHFEYCNQANTSAFPFPCTVDGVHDLDQRQPNPEDDFFCFNPTDSSRIQIGGCLNTDGDFDGPEYQLTWPGTFQSPGADKSVHPESILFTSPVFTATGSSSNLNYQRVAFEADMPRIEDHTIPPCQRHVLNPSDPNPGQGCVNPPVGSAFYPIYTTGTGTGQILGGLCVWQLGGTFLPGTTNSFGGSSATEFGTTPLGLNYPTSPPGTPQTILEDFRNIQSTNPCPAPA